LLLALAASLVTCRFDKLINPAIRDRLVVSPASVDDSAHAGSSDEQRVTLRIASADGATLSWTARTTSPWLSLSPSSGGAPDSLVVTLDPEPLAQNLHQGTILLTSPQARDTVRVPVSFNILPPAPELRLSDTAHADTAFARSALPDTFTLWIENTGALPLTWNAALDTGWVVVSDSGGSVPAQDSMAVLVTLRPESLSAGAHRGTITFTAPGAIGSGADVSITFTIQPCPETLIGLDSVKTGSVALSDCGAPHRPGRQAKLFFIQPAAGDTLSVRLTAAFDAVLILSTGAGDSLTANEQCGGDVGSACITNFIVTTGGRYLIEATTAASGETGTFSLSVVRERTPGVPQTVRQFRGDSLTAIAAGQVITENVAVFKGTLTDPNLRDSVRLELELTGESSGLRSDSSAFVPVTPGGVVVAVRTTGLSDNEGYRWRARTCDKTGRCSAWVGYGDPSPAVDFYVNHILEAPPTPTSLNQFHGGNPIPPGGGTGGLVLETRTVTFQGVVTDFDPRDVISLEVEVRRTSEGFTGNGTAGVPVPAGGAASVSMGFTVELLGASYHWRARACDQTNRCSAWVSFGGSDGSADFTVP